MTFKTDKGKKQEKMKGFEIELDFPPLHSERKLTSYWNATFKPKISKHMFC